MQSYRYRGKVYTVAVCVKEDIPSHLERVLSYYDPNEIGIQKERMSMAVYNGTAFKLIDSSGETLSFLYYEQLTEKDVAGIALWWASLKWFCILGRWFRPTVQIEYIHILPHNKTFVPFAFLTDTCFIEEYNRSGTPLAFYLWSSGCERIKVILDKMGLEEL